MSERTKNLGQKISDHLYNQIIQGKYQPGDKLPNELELAEAFSVSRATIREAIRSLSAQGILKVKRGSGTYIVPDIEKFNRTAFKDFEHMKLRLRDFVEVRLIIEPECAALTCKRATDEEIEQILSYGQLSSHSINNNLDGWLQANHDFHNAIAKASHNDLMEQFIPILTKSIDDISTKLPQIADLEDNTIIDHSLIMDFIKHRNAEGARNAMRIHILHMIDSLELYDIK